MIAMGAHVDQADPIAEANARGARVSQFFLGDPQGWKGPQVAYAGGAAALRADAEAAGVALYVHAPYVLNVASTNNRIRIPSRQHLQKQLTAAAEIGAAGVIVHGGHLGAKEAPEIGYTNWFKAVEGLDIAVPLLIENTAGGTNAMARTLASIERLWAAVSESKNADMVGFCLDTCHAHAGGNELLGLVDRVRAITGRVDLIHANDSRDAFDSGADRHANWGTGHCDPDGVADVLRSADAPVVIETPGGVAEHVRDLTWLAERF
ncbi:deoxyribonuclease IV [Micropruina sonneratiae]|uniref:deoxyribonuclease IV n=1 Tax=Micropruina sonneratiae TaxID=2986940 RepID=UPI0022266F18|nr:deoxyribonuclease IV [Micropruina sp. KQZ13P-5]MCW3159203.1 deoxyribonuclease IV [Micropruina sp. KQZ13P-5]